MALLPVSSFESDESLASSGSLLIIRDAMKEHGEAYDYGFIAAVMNHVITGMKILHELDPPAAAAFLMGLQSLSQEIIGLDEFSMILSRASKQLEEAYQHASGELLSH